MLPDILGILYTFEKNSFLLNSLGIYKILMLKKIWEKFFPRCLKTNWAILEILTDLENYKG
jgi:hypothetical protein